MKTNKTVNYSYNNIINDHSTIIESILKELDISNYNTFLKTLSISIDNLALSNAVLTLYDRQTWDRTKLVSYIEKSSFTHKIPRAFSGISVKFPIKTLNNKEITTIFFKSGKCVIVGITPQSIYAIKELFDEISKIIIYSECSSEKPLFSYKISNKVYSFTIAKENFPGALCDWYNKLPEARKYFEYNAVMFPGATIRVPGYSAVILIFNSRKCIITGGKNADKYFEASMQCLNNYINLLKTR